MVRNINVGPEGPGEDKCFKCLPGDMQPSLNKDYYYYFYYYYYYYYYKYWLLNSIKLN